MIQDRDERRMACESRKTKDEGQERVREFEAHWAQPHRAST